MTINALEVAVYVFLTTQPGQAFDCAAIETEEIFCTNGIRAGEGRPGMIEMSNGVSIEKTRDGQLRFSTGLTGYRNAIGWIEFSSGVSVRRMKPGLYKFNNGYSCSADGPSAARCTPP